MGFILKFWQKKIIFILTFFNFLWLSNCGKYHPQKRLKLGFEKVLKSFPNGININSISIAPAGKEKLFIAWSNDNGVHGIVMNRDGKVIREISIQDTPVKFISIAGAECGTEVGEILILIVPFTSPVEGNKEATLGIVDIKGEENIKWVSTGTVGPYSLGGTVSATCQRGVVALHTGRIGDFSIEVAGIDIQKGSLLWQKRISEEGTNAFLPSVYLKGKLSVVGWFEKKISITRKDEDSSEGILKIALIEEDGTTRFLPSHLAVSKLSFFSPALFFDGKYIVVIYKDRPEDEYHDGLYMIKTDTEGKKKTSPIRIARADGNSNPVLIPLPFIGYSVLVLRKLAGDSLVGINLIDDNGRKLQKEIQIYSHGMKMANTSAVFIDGKIFVVYSVCLKGKCKLCVMDVRVDIH